MDTPQTPTEAPKATEVLPAAPVEVLEGDVSLARANEGGTVRKDTLDGTSAYFGDRFSQFV
jgi:hypothetical protein